MPRFILAFTLCAIGTSVSAAPYPTPAELINQACDAGNKNACIELATLTAGQCASPGGLGGCRFDSLITY